MLLTMLVLLLAAGCLSILFSLLLPTSASILAPTSTPTPTATNTPNATPTPTQTITPLPPELVTPNVTQFSTYTVIWSRDLWENATGKQFLIEDFEKDPNTYGELVLPYMTGNGLLLNGKSLVQMLNDTSLLQSGNLLHFRDPGQGLTFIFPGNQAARAFGFDYTSLETWRLTFNNLEIILPEGRSSFVGIIVQEGFPKEFNLFCLQAAQGGLSVDNISYIP